jgi:hypothetical protein
MITNFLITQHEKALKVLALIDKANYYNRDHKLDIARLNDLEFWHPAKDNVTHLQKRVEINKAIINRLQTYYISIMKKLTYDIVAKRIAA